VQRILERDYQVDENLIKDYFPFETVTEGTLVPSHHHYHHSLQASQQ
jgi:Zn-dependent oligopeptidase